MVIASPTGADAAELSTAARAQLPTPRWATWLIAVLWIAAVIAATVQQGVSQQNNNYLIFRAASQHLLAAQDMYASWPALHFDNYKYSPTFALLFVPFAVLPFVPSMLLWNALNAAVLYFAIGTVLRPRAAAVARAVVFLDMLGSLQNVQSNALVTGLIILTFASFESRHEFPGALAATTGAVIKVFPLAGLSFALFHTGWWRIAVSTVLSAVVLLALPLLVTSPSELAAQYASWRALETSDAIERNGSLMQITQQLFGGDWPNWPQQLAGVLLLVAPILVRRDRWHEWTFRRLYLCSVLLFCVLFNHQTESPSFVIAVAGAAIWFASLERRSRGEWALFAFVVVCTILASSDAMPEVLQRELFDRYRFKIVPLIVLWGVLQARLWRGDSSFVVGRSRMVAANDE